MTVRYVKEQESVRVEGKRGSAKSGVQWTPLFADCPRCKIYSDTHPSAFTTRVPIPGPANNSQNHAPGEPTKFLQSEMPSDNCGYGQRFNNGLETLHCNSNKRPEDPIFTIFGYTVYPHISYFVNVPDLQSEITVRGSALSPDEQADHDNPSTCIVNIEEKKHQCTKLQPLSENPSDREPLKIGKVEQGQDGEYLVQVTRFKKGVVLRGPDLRSAGDQSLVQVRVNGEILDGMIVWKATEDDKRPLNESEPPAKP